MNGFAVMVKGEKPAIRVRKPLSSAGTHVGKRRSQNEDRYLNSTGDQLYAVADGMGGHEHGEVCADECIQRLHRESRPFPKKLSPKDAAVSVKMDVLEVNRQLQLQKFKDKRLEHAGSTLIVAKVYQRHVIWCNVGDSRLYHIRPSAGLKQITKDQGHGGMLEECMGIMPDAKPDCGAFPAVSGDLILLCSDGLTDMVDNAGIFKAVKANRKNGIDAMRNALIDAALDGGGRDNITVILVQMP